MQVRTLVGKRKWAKQSWSLTHVCFYRRSYLNENSFTNHLNSKKHKELEFKASPGTQETTHSNSDKKKQQGHRQQLFSDDDDELEHTMHMEDGSVEGSTANDGSDRALVCCLFCHHTTDHFDSNLQHMVQQHGFFLPDVEYLVNAPGLISYLFEKVVQDHICLYCNDKKWRSVEAVRAHMVKTEGFKGVV